jgi:anti-sigma factor RsiW
MNCENCQNLLSDWLDNELAPAVRIEIGAHLAVCPPCRVTHDELNSIVGFCAARRGSYDAVPNEEALWRRICNTVEAEQGLAARETPAVAPESGSWWARLWNGGMAWPQWAGSLAAVALVVSLMSVGMAKLPGAVRGLVQSGATAGVAAGNRLESLVQSRQASVDYWYQRVEQRRARWSPQIRQAFDYNLNILDQAARESSDALQQNPQDAVSAERLNIVLEDKMELLKEFANR